jgi:ATP-binding cassette, subfamily B, bacterial
MTLSTPASPLRRLLRHARRHRRHLALASLCSFFNKLFDLAPPLLIGAAIDVVVKRQASLIAEFGIVELNHQLWALAGATLVVWGFESAFEYAHGVLWRNLAQTVQHELRLDAYSHTQSLELAQFEDRSTGGLMAILNDDINQLERFLDGGANDLIQVATTVVLVGVLFFGLAWQVALLAFLPVPLVVLGSLRFQRRIAPRYAAVREQVGSLNAQLANNLQGVATIKSFVAEDREVARIRALSDAYRRTNRDAIRLSSAFSPLIRMVIVVGFTATLVVGGWLVDAGTLAVGAYGLLVFMTQRLLWPLTRLGQTFDLYQRAMASTERVLDLLAVPTAIVSGDTELTSAEGAVALESVRFRYASGPEVLDGIDLVAAPSQTTAIVGATGAGKSTIVKLLLRFYDPTAGCVRLDGHDLRDLTLPSLRRCIGLVSQDVYLFHGSVRENIAYGMPDASHDAIVAAATTAEADDFIRRLPEGYDTVIGERGQKLSGGQRQRLSIARAVLTDPRVLVLDEATSSVDNETEAAIQRSLERIAVDRTVIVIAHRLSTVRQANRIYVLERGKVSEMGTHEALIASDGIYAGLWRVQTGDRGANVDARP